MSYGWDGNENGEKWIQPVKKEFVSKKGKFAIDMIEKFCSKETMKNLSNEIDCDSKAFCDISNNRINITKILMEKLKLGLPVSFVINEINKCFF